MFNSLRYQLHKIKRPQRYQLLSTLLQNQTLSQEQLFIKSEQELDSMVRFAIAHTHYYRKRYAALPLDNDTVIKSADLPILSKNDVMSHREAMLADTVDRNAIRLGSTGGSTGKPVSFYYDDYKMELMRAGMSRSYMWSGWQPGQKILNFWGARQDIKSSGIGKRYSDFIKAEKTIGAYEYSEAELDKWVKMIKQYQPVLLQGYASVLAELANYVLDNNIIMSSSLRGVYSTAEVLYDSQRQAIETAFACKVYNQYGCREIPNIAIECQQGNMHVFTDMVNLESVLLDGDHKLIITSLTNFLMPMIRYENGDTGKLKSGQCACGSPFPMMEMGMCRSNDIIKTKTGKNIYPSYFIHLLDGIKGIKQYQFIQSELDKIILNIHASDKLNDHIQAGLQQKIRLEIDPDMQLEIIQSDEIKRTVSGKYRFVISDLTAL